MQTKLRNQSVSLAALLWLIAAYSPVAAQSTPAAVPAPANPSSAAPTDWLNFGSAPAPLAPAPKGTAWGQDLLNSIAPPPLNEGKILFDSRLRYESVSQTGVNSSKALTLRTKIGYQTPDWYGLYGVGEFENTWAINHGSYAPYPAPFNNGKAVIADPRNNEINQLFVGYAGFQSELKAGRQIINLDNQRFVGAVDWRQNDQTYDAVRFTTQAVKDLWISYAWNWRVNRVYGTDSPSTLLTPATSVDRFNSNNQFINVHYMGLPKFGTLGAYVYNIDLQGATAARVTSAGTQQLSSLSSGVYFDGKYVMDADWALLYRAEYAFQTDTHGDGPGSFWDNYYHFRLGGAYDNKYEMGAAFENLGGNGIRAFQTPLATLHAFNGWADQFLTTPAAGLRDYYLWAKSPLPLGISLSTELHYFTAVNTDQTYGREADLVFTRKFGENITALVGIGQYWGNGLPNTGIRANVTKIWLQAGFSL